MIKDIKFNGYTAKPGDYECLDGDLSGMVNLVPEDSALKPVLPPAELFACPEGKRVVFSHEKNGLL